MSASAAIPVHGFDFLDVLKLFNDDPGTEAVVMIGEIGGSSEEEAAAWIKANMKKPMAGFIAGQTAPSGKTHGARRRDHLRRQRDGERKNRSDETSGYSHGVVAGGHRPFNAGGIRKVTWLWKELYRSSNLTRWRRNLIGEILRKFEAAGLRIAGGKLIRLTPEQAQAFYAVHKARPFFQGLCDYMSSGADLCFGA